MSKLFIIPGLIFLWACNGATEQKKPNWTEQELMEKKSLVKDVMDTHDATMIFMDSIHNTIAELEALIQSSDSSKIEEIDGAIQSLQKADESMMQWMRNYREPRDTVPFLQAKEYLKNQKVAISEVEVQTDSALKLSEKILSNVQDTIR